MNHDDRTLKDLLDSTAPDRPDLPAAARTTAVRDRARVVRRRQGLVLAAAVVAVAGIGIGVPVLTSGDDPDGSTQVAGDPAAGEPTGPAVVPPVECPADPPVIDETSAKADFPDGATSLRLCPATFDTAAGAVDFTLPTEPVTDDVDGLLDRVAAQPAYVFPTECMSMTLAPMPWTMVVGYPDGSTASVGSTLTGCASVTVDGQEVDVETTLTLLTDAVGAPAGG